MNIDKVMHLRAVKQNRGIREPEFVHGKRGVTVIGSFVWNMEENRQDIVFSWAIQDPRDQYCKKTGIQQAKKRMEEGLIIQTNYETRFSLKYQFFNAVANAREYFHHKEVLEPGDREKTYFIDLTFYALAEIAEQNEWFMDISSRQLPSIHPDILINYVYRMNKVQLKMCGITNIIGRSPLLTEIVNKTYGV